MGLPKSDDTNDKIFQYILEKPLTGEMQKKGCYLIKLPEELLLEPGKKYAVVITLESDEENIILAKFHKDTNIITYENTKESTIEDENTFIIEENNKDEAVHTKENTVQDTSVAENIEAEPDKDDNRKETTAENEEAAMETNINDTEEVTNLDENNETTSVDKVTEENIDTNENQKDNICIYIKKEDGTQWEKIESYDYGIRCYTKEYLDYIEITDKNETKANEEVITNIPNNENSTNIELQQNKDEISKKEVTATNSLDNSLLTLLDKEADSKQEKNSMMIAHRGMSSLAPENSIVAFEMAGIYGYQGVEFDVYQTKDGKYVVFHDPSVDRMTNGSGSITDKTLSQIKKLTIDSGNGIENYSNLKIPTLEETLECCKQYNLIPCIDIKSAQNVKGILKVIKKYGFTKTVKISSRSETVLKEIRKRNKKIYLNLINSTNGIEAVKKAKRFKCNGISLIYKKLNNEVVEYAKKADIEITVWKVNSLSSNYKCQNYGINKIITNGITNNNYYDNLSLDSSKLIEDGYYMLSDNPNVVKQVDSIEKCLTNKNTWFEEKNINTANVGDNSAYHYNIVDNEIEKGAVIIVTAQVNSISGKRPYFTVKSDNNVIGKVCNKDKTTGWQKVKLVYTADKTSHINVLFGLKEKEAGIFRIKNIEISRYSRYDIDDISMNETTIELTLGKTYNMLENIQYINRKVITMWKSSKNKIATVSSSGRVEAKKIGKAKIYLTTDDGSTSKCTVIVKPKKMPKVKISKQASHSIKLTWSKISSVSGYEIYGKKSGEKDYKLVKNIKKKSKTTAQLKNLKSNKKYYYKIRAYKTINGKKYYGKFSKVTKVKI